MMSRRAEQMFGKQSDELLVKPFLLVGQGASPFYNDEIAAGTASAKSLLEPDLLMQMPMTHEDHERNSQDAAACCEHVDVEGLRSFIRTRLRHVEDYYQSLTIVPIDQDPRSTVREEVVGSIFEVVVEHLVRRIHNGPEPFYARDLHLPRLCKLQRSGHCERSPKHKLEYDKPAFAKDDWFEYCYLRHVDCNDREEQGICGGDDFGFVYVGAHLSWTPMHRDVLGSHSWSANACGQKLWVLCSPTLRSVLTCQSGLRPDVWSLFAIDLALDGWSQVPHTARESLLENVHLVLQCPGQVIHVPSGWLHAVYNIGHQGVVSLNHNWANALCLPSMWSELCRELDEVHDELANHHVCTIDSSRCTTDAIEFDQKVLRALSGSNICDFVRWINLCASELFLRNYDECMSLRSISSAYLLKSLENIIEVLRQVEMHTGKGCRACAVDASPNDRHMVDVLMRQCLKTMEAHMYKESS